jgi:hypothetical protein
MAVRREMQPLGIERERAGEERFVGHSLQLNNNAAIMTNTMIARRNNTVRLS